MEADEIMERCMRRGVLVLFRGRVLYDVYGSDLPYADNVVRVDYHKPNDIYDVVDGVCMVRKTIPLRWESHGTDWCFPDDDETTIRERNLRKEIHARNAKNRKLG